MTPRHAAMLASLSVFSYRLGLHRVSDGSGPSVPNAWRIRPAGVAFVADVTANGVKRGAQSWRTWLKCCRIATHTRPTSLRLRTM